jgi:hypothetical protein
MRLTIRTMSHTDGANTIENHGKVTITQFHGGLRQNGSGRDQGQVQSEVDTSSTLP